MNKIVLHNCCAERRNACYIEIKVYNVLHGVRTEGVYTNLKAIILSKYYYNFYYIWLSWSYLIMLTHYIQSTEKFYKVAEHILTQNKCMQGFYWT